MKSIRMGLLGAVAATAIAGAAAAETLTIGVSLESPSIDPHFYNYKNSNQIAQQMFDLLIRQDAQQQYMPGLALEWNNLDDKTWEIKLRKGVKWHDGSPFTADDVLFNIERAKVGIPGSPTTPTRNFLLGGKEWKAIDDHTLQVVTEAPHATFAADLTGPVIVSRKHGEGAETKDYNAGPATIGTGPFKFVDYIQGDKITLEANPDYWGGKPEWDQVVVKALPNGPARLAALLSGTVDVINDVPTEDIEALRKNDKISVTIAPSNLVIRFLFGHGRMTYPWVRDNNGEVLFPNPLRDWRVRKAISLTIDRDRIVDRVMAGTAVAAGQAQPPGGHAHDPALEPGPYDPDQARKLLADAGYGDGFQLTIHSPDSRYPNDKQIGEAVAQMLRRVGIQSELELVPNAVFSSRASKGEFAFVLGAWGTPSGDGGNFLVHGLHTYQPGKRLGAANWGRYNNRDLDELVVKSNTELDAKKREDLVREAWRMVTKDVGNVWVLWVANTWAARADLVVDPRIDSYTMGTTIHKK